MIHPVQLADAHAFLAAQPTDSAHLLIADPPFRTTCLAFDQRSKKVDWLTWWAEAERVLAPAGMVAMFTAGLFTFEMYATNPAMYRYRRVWEKSKPTNFLSANRQPLNVHEDILIFGRNGNASTYNPQKQPTTRPNKTNGGKKAQRADHYGTHRAVAYVDDGTRFPTSVMHYPSVPTIETLNQTEKPLGLLRELVLTYTNPGEQVLDCFCGSGVSAVACWLERRAWAGCDDDPEQVDRANARIRRAKRGRFDAAGKTKLSASLDLFTPD